MLLKKPIPEETEIIIDLTSDRDSQGIEICVAVITKLMER
jgi:hypothetical protein